MSTVHRKLKGSSSRTDLGLRMFEICAQYWLFCQSSFKVLHGFFSVSVGKILDTNKHGMRRVTKFLCYFVRNVFYCGA